MTGYSKPFKLRIAWGDYGRDAVPFATAEARQASIDRLRLMAPDLYDELEREFGPPTIETWEVMEPEVTSHDPGLYRPPPTDGES